MAFGGICGSLLGGYTLSKFRIDTIFLLFSILPAIQLLSCALIDEVPCVLQKTIYQNTNGHTGTKQATSISTGHTSSIEKPKSETSRRRKNRQHKTERRAISVEYENIEHQNQSLFAKWYLSLKSAIYQLCTAFKQPAILRPMAWFFFSLVIVPNFSTAMFYYQTEVLHLEASFLGAARVIGWFGLMIGTYAYNRYLKHLKLRRILMFAHIGLAIIALLDIVLVSRLNIKLAVSDTYMVLFGSALGDAINQFKMMPFLIISGQLCPPGIEGTLFALFMSINNFGSTLGSFFGATLASLLNISSQSFDNLIFGMILQFFASLIPIGFLFLIPKEATGVTSQ